MNTVVIASRSDVRLELLPAAHPEGETHEGMPSWDARLLGAGLEARVPCTEANWERMSLAEFLASLDADWRGWDGEREWRSLEREVHLAATHEKTNTVLLRVTFEDGAPPRWRCEAELEVDPGALRAPALAARHLNS